MQFHAFLTSGLQGCEWSASRPGCSTPGEREIPLGAPRNIKFCRESNLVSSDVSLIDKSQTTEQANCPRQ
jgi:hypothetical protein